MATNGKTTTIIILVGALQAIVLFGGGLLCNGVIANENKRVLKDAEHGERITRIEECVVSIKDDIREIKLAVVK